MKRDSLNKTFRDILASDYSLRTSIGSDISVHERTIQRWAVNDSPKLCTKHFIASLKKHGKINQSVALIEQVAITQPHEVTA